MSAQPRWRPGGCHCRAVRFEVRLGDDVATRACTCSICTMTGYEHVIVESQAFRLLQGESRLTRYAFNTGVASHLFCEICGVKSFYRPRSHPQGWSVNARCLDADASITLAVGPPFDGRNWEAYFASATQGVPETR